MLVIAVVGQLLTPVTGTGSHVMQACRVCDDVINRGRQYVVAFTAYSASQSVTHKCYHAIPLFSPAYFK